jgi:hypothetical protein
VLCVPTVWRLLLESVQAVQAETVIVFLRRAWPVGCKPITH